MYQRILVPIDGSPTSNLGLVEAMKFAKLTGARLRLIHVVDELSFAMGSEAYVSYAGEIIAVLREAGEKVLAEAKTKVEAAGLGVDVVLRENVTGRVCELIIEEVKLWPAELIVLGTHGRRGLERLFMGSDAEEVIRMAPVPVLLVRSSADA